MYMEHEVIGLDIVVVLLLILIIISWNRVPIVNCVPSSVVAVCLGLFISSWSSNTPFEFAPELFLYLMLPSILFSSSFKFRPESLKRTWLSSMVFAWIGTLLAIIMIAWGIVVWGSFMDMNISVIDALMIGSILAPTDTVATIALSKTLDDTFIAEVIENEAVMNDAIAVVLVRLFANMSLEHQELNRWIPMRAVGVSMLFMVAACWLGLGCSYVVRRLQINSTHLHLICALLVYSICEYVGISGIVGLFSYGSTLNAPKQVKETVESFAVIIESYVYLTLGFALKQYDTRYLGISLLILVSCVAGRCLVVFILGGCLKLSGETHWTVRSLLYVSLCGVRGAISFAICMGLRSQWSELIRSTTFVVVIFTIVFMGSLQKCMQFILLNTKA